MGVMFITPWGGDEPVEVGVTPRSIQPAVTVPTIVQAKPAVDGGIFRHFINYERNSRIPWSLGLDQALDDKKFELSWQTSLPESFSPFCVVTSGDRVVVQGEYTWQLLDRGGKLLQTGHLRKSGVTIDPERSDFYAADVTGDLVTRNLTDGQEDFRVPLYYGEKYRREFVARRKDRLITVGSEILVDLDGPDPETCSVEVADLSDPYAQKSSLLGTGSPNIIKRLLLKSTLLHVAVHEASVVLATHDHIFHLNLELEFQQALTGVFVPLAMSLDEAGRIYLIIEVEGYTALWLLTKDGVRLYEFSLPSGIGALIAPPIVGYDHTAYLISRERIIAVDASGEMIWTKLSVASFSGAVVTADDVLLVSDGPNIVTFDDKGNRRVLYSFPGEELSTSPILTETGDILVASSKAIYCLKQESGKNDSEKDL